MKLVYDPMDTTQVDMCSSNIPKTVFTNWMGHAKYFDDMFESFPDWRNVVSLMFLNKDDVDILHTGGFSKTIVNVSVFILQEYYLNKMMKNLIFWKRGRIDHRWKS